VSPVLACWLAGEFAATALAKAASDPGQATVPSRWLPPRLDRRLPIGWDVGCALLLLLPATRAAASVAVLLTVLVGAVLELTSAGAGCGCFGTAAKSRWAWRDIAARLALAGQAVLLWELPDAGWILGMLAGAGGALLLVAAQPQLAIPARALTPAEALRRLGTDPQLVAWRPRLLSDQPASVEPHGKALRLTFDAIAEDALVLLVVDVSRYAVTVRAVDPFTLAPVS
jgi:hypothetical protein